MQNNDDIPENTDNDHPPTSEPRLNAPTVSGYTELLILRIFFEFDCLRKFFLKDCWESDEIAAALGLPAALEKSKGMKQTVKKLLKERYTQLDGKVRPSEDWEQAEQNLASLSERLQLNETETAILRLSLYLNAEKVLMEALNYLGRDINFRRLIRLLSEILRRPSDEIRLAMHKQQKLLGYGLLDGERYNNDFDDYLDWGDTLVLDDFYLSPFDEAALLKTCLQPAAQPSLQWAQFDHIADMRDRITRYLQSSYQNNTKGVNILIYGAPGTGKTEFAALLGSRAGVPCYTLKCADEEDDMFDGEKRLQNCTLAQTLMAGRTALLVFDEVEDVFGSSLFERSVAQSHKAWVNRFLENNPLPMVWISNTADCLDAAFLRRFDIVLEMPDLPQRHKAALIRDLSDGRLDEDAVQHLSKQDGLTAAILERGFKVAKSLAAEGESLQEHVFGLLNQTVRARGGRKIHRPPAGRAAYSLDWVACDGNLAKISEGLRQKKRGRVCCWGPPGTGKTAWANWLGEQAGLSVLQRHGSDLLDKYVGQTEQKIAAAFDQAAEENLLLVLDEIDSFLFTREGADKSWERSMVNEMLTQIERFDGLLVVSTNMMRNLDPAALRRFDLKLHFGFLKPPQIIGLAREQAALLGLPEPDPAGQNRLKRIANLTPGDFAASARRHEFAAFETTAEWIGSLEEECALKPSGGKGMGFV
ncbi:MAG: AAA family ATPase [Neisseria sp.]|nr:AAA family ATPase [Neisseria sp.]